MSIETKHYYYQKMLLGTPYVLCKESAAEFLDLSNGNFSTDIYYYESSDGVDYIEDLGIKCTTINQTLNDLLQDVDSDEQILLESLSRYYYKHSNSFSSLVIKSENIQRFEELKQDAIDYYNE